MVLIIGRKLLDEFVDGAYRTRVIPTVIIRVADGVVEQGSDPREILSSGERYYAQYSRAGQLSDVIPMQLSDT